MATKKQKRAQALAKHEEFMEERRLSGLEAQKKDREYRARQSEKRQAEAQKESDRLEAILVEKQELVDRASLEQECV